MTFSYPAYLIIISSLAISCSSSGLKPGEEYASGKKVLTGKVIPVVSCRKDTSVKYALYLPSGYSNEKKYPALLAFDPHAAGEIPVEKYDSLAELYGYILIGSNNSKNGLPMDETEKIVSTMLSEVTSEYSADSSRIYLMGFSGGARIASLVALFREGIRGVIGCGAGFPGTSQPGRYRFDYIGFAGNADFNMNELVSLDGQLDQAGFRHALVIFDGKHEWPSTGIMKYGFIWNEFCEMKDGKTNINRSEIPEFHEMADLSIQKARDKKDHYQERLAIEQKIRFLQGIESVDREKQELARLITSEAYKFQERKINAMREKERKEQQMFTENFFTKDLGWWGKTITDYELRITNEKDREEVLMYKRIMSYLSLLAYMNYTHAESAGDKVKADFALQVYRIVDPENAAKIK